MHPRTRSGLGIRLVLALVALLLGATTASAAGVLVPRDGSPPIEVQSHRVTAVVDDGLARTTVRQTFVNPHGRPLEAVYVFPVPDGAALVDLAMETGGQRLEGLLAERRTARRAYDAIVGRGRDPALVEQIGRSTFRLSVFPVLPNQPTVVEMTWIEPVPLAGGEVRYVYRLADGDEAARTEQDLTVSVTIRSSAPIESATSPSDGMAVYLHSDHEVRASVERTGARLDRDLVVAARIAPAEPSLAVRWFRGATGDPYFAVVVTPPTLTEDRILPRDLTLALDTSGSMEGGKLDQAKAAADGILRRLRARDRVNVVLFSDTIRALHEAPVEATFDAVEDARRFVREAVAQGGTALGDAIAFTSGAPTAAGRVALGVVVTDGIPTVGEQRPEAIVAFARGGSGRGLRTFAFGVGRDVNRALLDGVAQAGNGRSEAFVPDGEIETRLLAFGARTSSPVATGLRLEIDGKPATDVLPRPLPDLYLGEQAVICGRAPLVGRHEFVLHGVLGGETVALRGSADFGGPVAENAAAGEAVVRDLYARGRLDFLEQAHRLRAGLTDEAYYAALDRGAYATSDELVRAMIDLSLETGVQCAYTSFLALLPEDRARLDPRDSAALDAAMQRASAKRREIAGLPQATAPSGRTTRGPGEAAPAGAGSAAARERVVDDPVLKDADVSDHNEADDDLPDEVSLEDPRFDSYAPFERPDSDTIGVGGGAGGRRTGHRILRAGGGGKKTLTAVDRGLAWLAGEQRSDGGWSAGGARSDRVSTGFALLAFLGAGETHQSGEFKDNVKNGLRALRNWQDTEGCIGTRTGEGWMFGHMVATLALTEGYGATQSVVFRDVAQRAVDFVVAARNPGFGWGAAPRDGRSDTFLTMWAVMCLRSAQEAGLTVDAAAFSEAAAFVVSRTDPATGRVGATAAGVVPPLPEPGTAAWPPATEATLRAAAALTHSFCAQAQAVLRGEPAPDAGPAVVETALWLTLHAGTDAESSPATADVMARWLGTLLSHRVGGVLRAERSRLSEAELKTQHDGTGLNGSWDPGGPFATEGGRVYATALRVLLLEVHYRYGRAVGTR